MDEALVKAKEQYRGAGKEGKAMLEKIFGKENLKEESNWIKLWERFCQEHQLSVTLPFPNPSNRDEESENAFRMLKTIIRIRNRKDGQDWAPNYNDNTWKYEPRFDLSGFGFSRSGYAYWRTGTSAGSRLCYRDYNVMVHTVEEFLPIYEKFITL